MSALAGLPSALLALVSEAAPVEPPAEPRSDCARCPMAAAPGTALSRARPFLHDARCCTYHPRLPNFLVGSALRRGGPGAERLMARLASPEGVGAMGVDQPEAQARAYRERAPSAFGRDRSLRCPYWVGGEHACGIWEDRGAVCRSWHCLHVDGRRGRALWGTLQEALEVAEYLLASDCVTAGQPPTGEAPDDWAAWYRWCAERVATLPRADALALATPLLDRRLTALADARAEHLAPLPERVGPMVRAFRPEGEGVVLSADSDLDTLTFPAAIFQLISRLDGRPWRQALAEAQEVLADLNAAPLPPDVVERLWRAGLLEPREPGATTPAVRIRRGDDERTYETLPRLNALNPTPGRVED